MIPYIGPNTEGGTKLLLWIEKTLNTKDTKVQRETTRFMRFSFVTLVVLVLKVYSSTPGLDRQPRHHAAELTGCPDFLCPKNPRQHTCKEGDT